MKTQSFPDPEPGCTCIRPWLAVIPPPPCPVHGQAYMLKASNVKDGEITIAKMNEYVISAASTTNGTLTANLIRLGSTNTNSLDGQ